MHGTIGRKMVSFILLLETVALMSSSVVRMEAASAASAPNSAHVEPGAGIWKTWVLASGSQLRLPPPPDPTATKDELRALKKLAAQRDAQALDRISYWDAGAPGYRWNELAVAASVKHNVNIIRASRMFALLDVAIYDATIAAWNTKYTHQRPRPTQFDRSLRTALATPASRRIPTSTR